MRIHFFACLLFGVAVGNAQSVRIVGTRPQVAHVDRPLFIVTEGESGFATKAWFTAADGSEIETLPVPHGFGALRVPPGAVSGKLRVEWNRGSGQASLFATGEVTVYPRLRLRPERLRLAAGETITIHAVAKDVPSFPLDRLHWRADFGNIDSAGRFTAPSIDGSRFARIHACLERDIECSSTVVEVLPFRLEQDPVILNLGESLQLRSRRGTSEIACNWEAVTKNITITAEGMATAGNGPFDGGLALVSATSPVYGRQIFEIQINGNGAVSHTAEYFDYLGADGNFPFGRLPLGTLHGQVAVNGDWVYATASNLPVSLLGSWHDSWLDVYKLDARRVPQWVTAIEYPRNTGSFQLRAESQQLEFTVDWNPGGVSYIYDVSAGIPKLVSRTVSTSTRPATIEGHGYRCALDPAANHGNSLSSNEISLVLDDLTSGVRRRLPFAYEPVYARFNSRAVCGEGWAAIMLDYPFPESGSSFETIVVDTKGERALPFAALPAGGFGFSMTALGSELILDRQVFHVGDRQVHLLSELPTARVVAVDRLRRRLLMAPAVWSQLDGYRVIDLNDPANPKISAPVVHPNSFTQAAALGEDFFVLGGFFGGVRVYPIRWQAGPKLLSRFASSPGMNDVRARNGFVYWVGPGWGVPGRSLSKGFFEVYDLAAAPPFESAAILDRPGDEVGWAIDLHDHHAYVGTDASLIVYDIRSPSLPVERLTIPKPAVSLARLDRYLYVGSYEGRNRSLLVYDLSNPASPNLVHSIPLPDYCYGITAQPGWLAVALGRGGLRMYSLANPARPLEIASSSSTMWGVASSPNHLYVAADYSGLMVYEFQPGSGFLFLHSRQLAPPGEPLGDYYPRAIGISYDNRGIVWICTPKDGRVYGLDVREPRQSRHVAEFTTQVGPYAAVNAAVSQNILFVAGNLAAFDIQHPQNVGLFEIRQTVPGSVLPDRFDAKPPFHPAANAESPERIWEHPKEKSLRERHHSLFGAQ